jgi:hypothetical protein
VQGIYCTNFAAWLLRTLPHNAWPVMMYGSLAFELLTPILFMVKPLRPIGLIWAIGFLTMISLTMYQLFYFTFQLLSMLVVFVDDKTLEKLSLRFTNFLPQ